MKGGAQKPRGEMSRGSSSVAGSAGGSGSAGGALWVFGYGSLIWRPGLDFSERREGYVRGFRRVWYQGSTDHRGTPERPGRTVTLQPAEGGEVWGAAYRLECDGDGGEAAALKYLDHREKQYDRRERLDVFGRDGSVVAPRALVYIGTPECENYLGPASTQELATQIAAAVGPSGPNSEYLFNLAEAMRGMDVEDSELFEIEALCRRVLHGRK